MTTSLAVWLRRELDLDLWTAMNAVPHQTGSREVP
jgi:hypothetical protein